MESALSIYHAFDMRYADVMAKLDELKEEGYTHIQLSPAQKSITKIPKSSPPTTDPNAWFFRYQPVEFVIGNYYGDVNDLKALTTAAHKRGLKIVSDVCLNFMYESHASREWVNAIKKAEHGDSQLLDKFMGELDTKYKPFDRNDFRPRSEYDKVAKRWKNIWFNGQLPCLNLDSPKVQGVHFQYLKDLLEAGVDGFRYDCAGYIDPKTMATYLNQNKESTYLELIERKNMKRIKTYSQLAPVIDFSTADFLKDSFKKSNENGLANLRGFEEYFKEYGTKNITFAVNHDTYNCEQSRLFVTFEDNNDRSSENLATTYLLAIKYGVPLIFSETAKNNFVKAGVKFKNLMKNEGVAYYPKIMADEDGRREINTKDVIVLNRGSRGLYIMNKGIDNINGPFIFKGDLNGEFTNLVDNSKITIQNQGSIRIIHGLVIKARTAYFFVKNDHPTHMQKKDGHIESIWGDLPGYEENEKKPDKLSLSGQSVQHTQQPQLSFSDFPPLGSSKKSDNRRGGGIGWNRKF